MVHREVTHENWFSRMGGAFKGLFVGGLMLVLALGLQFWNEGRTLKRDNALAEGRAKVVQANATAVDPALEGKLVHVSGESKAGSAPAPAAPMRSKVSPHSLNAHNAPAAR